MKLREVGKIVPQPGQGSRLGASLAAFKLANDVMEPRLRGPVAPPVVLGTPDKIGDPVVWLIGDDVVGFMHGTILASPEGKVRALFQDGLEREFNVDDRELFPDDIPQDGDLDARIILNVASPGINYFFGDPVLVNIHDANRQSAVVMGILDTPDTARVKLDSNGAEVGMPFSHMVLQGAGLSIPEVEANHNAVPGDVPLVAIAPSWRTFTEDQWRAFTEDQWRGFKE
jgi:hypothetical protein